MDNKRILSVFFLFSMLILSCNVGGSATTPAAESPSDTFIWKGSFPTHPENPSKGWAYFNTAKSITYFYDGEAWIVLADSSADTTPESFIWKGSSSAAPASPETGWVYFNTLDNTTYYYDGTGWVVLAQSSNLTTPDSFDWRGSLAAHPADPMKGWAYFNTTESLTYFYNGSSWEVLANNVIPEQPYGATEDFFYTRGPNGIIIVSARAGINSDIVIPSQLNGIEVYEIEAKAFAGAFINNLVIQGNVKIGPNAFQDCTGLISLVIQDDATIGTSAFNGCTSLTSIDIQANPLIQSFAFANCTSLANVDLANVTTIGNSIFSNCIALSTVKLGKLETAGSNSISGVIATNVTITVPNTSVCQVASDAGFAQCNIEILQDTLTLGDVASLANAVNLILPNVPLIPDGFFKGNTSLQSITMDSATNIGNNAFENCTSLVTVIAPLATTVGNSAFYSCSALEGVQMPQVLTTGENSFRDCIQLRGINLSRATHIGVSSFQGCIRMGGIDLSSNVVEISSNAFTLCHNTRFEVRGLGETAPTVATDIFTGLGGVIVMGIKGHFVGYDVAPWTDVNVTLNQY